MWRRRSFYSLLVGHILVPPRRISVKNPQEDKIKYIKPPCYIPSEHVPEGLSILPHSYLLIHVHRDPIYNSLEMEKP